VIVALWRRWTTDRRARWLALAAGVLVLDAIVGGWIIAWELRTFAGAW
jgi:heme A synthase